MRRSTPRKGSMSCVAMSRAMAVMAGATAAAQTIEVRWRLHASAKAVQMKPARSVAEAEGERTLKRRVSSQSMGAKMRAEVTAYVVLANQSPAGTRTAQMSHVQA